MLSDEEVAQAASRHRHRYRKDIQPWRTENVVRAWLETTTWAADLDPTERVKLVNRVAALLRAKQVTKAVKTRAKNNFKKRQYVLPLTI